jgi:hypothetical protein
MVSSDCHVAIAMSRSALRFALREGDARADVIRLCGSGKQLRTSAPIDPDGCQPAECSCRLDCGRHYGFGKPPCLPGGVLSPIDQASRFMMRSSKRRK